MLSKAALPDMEGFALMTPHSLDQSKIVVTFRFPNLIPLKEAGSRLTT